MSVTYGFYNSVNNDRKYNATQMSSLFDGIINDGVFMSVGDALIVTAMSGMNVSVGEGRAWFNRTWTENDAPLVLTVDQSELVLNRIDVVVLEVNSDIAVRANTIKIVKGTPSSVPVVPTLISMEFVHQYPLCHIYVGAGVSTIVQGNITNKIGTSECPFVTGILDTVDIDDLLLQWDAEFQVWFESLQDTLDENAAANLLNLINEHKADYVAQPANGGTTTGTATAYICSSSPNPSVLSDKIGLVITAHVDSGLNPTINWGGLGAKSIKKTSGAAAAFKAGGIYTLRYNGTSGNFILQGEGASGNALASNLLSGKTASTDAGPIVGTMVDRAGDTAALSLTRSGTTIRLRATEGYRDGTNDFVTHTDANDIAANIKAGVAIRGMVGTLVEGKPFSSGSEFLGSGKTTNVSLPFTPDYVVIHVSSSSSPSYNASILISKFFGANIISSNTNYFSVQNAFLLTNGFQIVTGYHSATYPYNATWHAFKIS